MNNKTINYLKEVLSNDNLKESINEVNELIQLGYVLNVMLLINTIDEVIVQAKGNNEIKKIIELELINRDATVFNFLNINLFFDDENTLKTYREHYVKINDILKTFTNDSIRNFFQRDFSIVINIDEYTKDKLADNFLSNMLTDDMRKIVDFAILDNKINNNVDINKKRMKI